MTLDEFLAWSWQTGGRFHEGDGDDADGDNDHDDQVVQTRLVLNVSENSDVHICTALPICILAPDETWM